MKSVYCAVRTGSLNKAVCASSLKGSFQFLPSTFVYQKRKLKVACLYTTSKCVLYSITYDTSFSSSFDGISDFLKNTDFSIHDPPQGSANGPEDHSWRLALCYIFPALHEMFQLLFKCWWFYAWIYVLFCNYVQLARRCNWNSYSSATITRN